MISYKDDVIDDVTKYSKKSRNGICISYLAVFCLLLKRRILPGLLAISYVHM